MTTLLFVLYFFAALPALFGVLVLAAVICGAARHRRELRRCARRTCERCGVIFGWAAVQAAEVERQQRSATRFAGQRPDVKLRMPSLLLRVVCPGCGDVAEIVL